MLPLMLPGLELMSMRIRRSVTLLLAILIASPNLAVAAEQPAIQSTGIFSSQASSLARTYMTGEPVTVTSPDGRSSAVARLVDPKTDEARFFIDVSGQIGSGQFEIAYGPNAELLWAPDSRAFFVTSNDGGITGSYLLSVIGRFDGSLAARDLTTVISKEFGHPVKCFDPEDPNVAGLTWLPQTRHLVAVAQIVRHSNCDSFGTFKAYEIDTDTSRIIRTFEQIEAKSAFGDALGPILTSAPDNCIRRPEECFIRQLHPELQSR